MNAAALVCLPAAALLGVAALHDVALRTVPNAIVTALAGCGLIVAALDGRLLPSLAVGAAVLGVAAILWLRRYLGGADAKLLGAVSLLVAPANVPLMLLAIALAGGLLCMPYLAGPLLFAPAAPGRPAQVLARLLRCERRRLRRRGPLPYAVAIATGTLFALLQGA